LVKAKKAKVHASVHIGPPKDMEGYGLAVSIQVEGDDSGLMKAAHKVCLDPMVNFSFY
jgi:hypothetical protein